MIAPKSKERFRVQKLADAVSGASGCLGVIVRAWSVDRYFSRRTDAGNLRPRLLAVTCRTMCLPFETT
jgi:hypothetical protein